MSLFYCYSCEAKKRGDQTEQDGPLYLRATGLFSHQPSSVRFAVAVKEPVLTRIPHRHRRSADHRPVCLGGCPPDLSNGAVESELLKVYDLLAIGRQMGDVSIW
jgi:hypothetical protein